MNSGRSINPHSHKIHTFVTSSSPVQSANSHSINVIFARNQSIVLDQNIWWLKNLRHFCTKISGFRHPLWKLRLAYIYKEIFWYQKYSSYMWRGKRWRIYQLSFFSIDFVKGIPSSKVGKSKAHIWNARIVSEVGGCYDIKQQLISFLKDSWEKS